MMVGGDEAKWKSHRRAIMTTDKALTYTDADGSRHVKVNVGDDGVRAKDLRLQKDEIHSPWRLGG